MMKMVFFSFSEWKKKVMWKIMTYVVQLDISGKFLSLIIVGVFFSVNEILCKILSFTCSLSIYLLTRFFVIFVFYWERDFDLWVVQELELVWLGRSGGLGLNFVLSTAAGSWVEKRQSTHWTTRHHTFPFDGQLILRVVKKAFYFHQSGRLARGAWNPHSWQVTFHWKKWYFSVSPLLS